MTPLEAMAEAARNPHLEFGTRLNKMRDDGLLFEVFYHEDEEIVSPVVVAAHPTQDAASEDARMRTDGARMRAAILALIAVDLPNEVLQAGARLIRVNGDGTEDFQNADVAGFRAMLSAIAQQSS
jgi:hypothetical protein